MPDQIITKSKLAEMLGVSKARLSQLVGKGLPVLNDGKLNLIAVLNWLNTYTTMDTSRVKPQQVGGLPEHFRFVDQLDNDADRAGCLAAMQMAYRLPRLIGNLAAEIGLPIKDVYVLHQMVMTAAVIEASSILASMGCQPFASDLQAPVWFTEAVCRVDWKAAAKAGGEPYDLVAWKAHLSTLEQKALNQNDGGSR